MTNSPAELPAARDMQDRAWRWTPIWVLAFVAAWPAPGIAEGLLSLGSLAMVAALAWRYLHGRRSGLGVPALALTWVLFLAYWLPQLLSAPDAVDGARAWAKAAAGLRYLPFLWLAALAVAGPARRRLTFAGLGWIVAIWTLDALVQAATGTSVLFWALDRLKLGLSGHGICSAAEIAAADRLSGFLGPCNPKLGQVLSSLSPFLLWPLLRRYGVLAWLAAAALLGVVIALAGSRASWITYALVLLVTGWRALGWRRLAVLGLAAVLALAALTAVSPQLQQRFARTALAFGGGEAGVDAALSGRAQIWGAAGCMIEHHPLNGVGARGFREAFPACDPLHGHGAAWGEGPALHAHQLVLEVLAETGVVGLLLWLAGAAMAWRAWRHAAAAARERARPAMLALAVTVFPLNTHLAFYSSFWGGVLVLLAGLYAGALLGEPGTATRS